MKLKNMNKKGFTLVELLAVIAILAILVVILVPNFVDMFKESKSSVFVTEVQTLMKQAQQDWMLAGGGNKTYKTGDFSLEGKSEKVNYYLEMDINGLFTKVVVFDEDNCLAEASSSIKMADLTPSNLINIGDPAFKTCKCTNPHFKNKSPENTEYCQ